MASLSDGETDAEDGGEEHDRDMHSDVNEAHIVVVGAEIVPHFRLWDKVCEAE